MFKMTPKPLGQLYVVVALCLGVAAVVPAAAGATAPDAPATETAVWRQTMRVAVERIRDGGNAAASALAAGGLVAEFYARRGFRPAWRDARKVEALAAVVAAAYRDGLDPADYHQHAIQQWLRQHARGATMTPGEWATFELTLTDALISLVHHQLFGKVDSRIRGVGRKFQETFGTVDTLALAQGAVTAPSLQAFIAKRLQRSPRYRRLRTALASYRRIAAAGGWRPIADGPSIEWGKSDLRIPALAARLAITGDLDDARPYRTASTMDATLEQAVRRFQTRHGLKVDGVVGSRTLAALNVPVWQRIEQLRLALERARWISRDLGSPHIIVNIPGYRAYVIAQQQIIWQSRVVVGKARQQTPVFRDRVQYLVLNPWWHVPYSIATQEMLPEIQAQPGWFQSNNYRVRNRAGAAVDPATVDWQAMTGQHFEYYFSQPPGPGNALGRVKFMFPNKYSVYLHDTPARYLFSQPRRAFSHGCIRLQNPLHLAAMLLRAKGWSRDRIDAILASGQTTTVQLARSVPILVLYSTANVTADGTVYFHPDIYDRDPALAKALDEPYTIK